MIPTTKRFLLLWLVFALFIPGGGLGESAAGSGSLPLAASIENGVKAFLQGQLEKQAEKTEDGWLRFVCEQGIGEISMNLEKFDIDQGKALSVSFTMAGGQPKIKTQPRYQGDSDTWLSGIVEAMKTKDVTVKTSLLLTRTEEGIAVRFVSGGQTALEKTLKTMADKASKSFSNADILAAVTDYLMPAPIIVPKKAPAALDPANYRTVFLKYVSRNEIGLKRFPYIPALLYSLRGYKLDVSAGPKDFVLTYNAPDLTDMLESAIKTLRLALCYDEKAKDYTQEEIDAMLLQEMEGKLIAYRHGKSTGETLHYSFSLLELPAEVSPDEFFTHLKTSAFAAFDNALEALHLVMSSLPSYPPVDIPKTGLLSGESKGTKCVFKSHADGYHRYVSVYTADTHELYSTFFIADGKTATVKIPEGQYYFVIALGDVWYGEEHLFGVGGHYSKSADIQVGNTRRSHLITLNPPKRGSISLFELRYEDLDA